MTVQYQPQGGMCRNCEKLKDDCSHLDFKNMLVLVQDFYSEKIIYKVLCNQFERKADDKK
jgi:hypothetical protein